MQTKMILKRDGTTEAFCDDKVKNAIIKAYKASSIWYDDDVVLQMTHDVANSIQGDEVSVEAIQDLVEKALMKEEPEVAKKYIIYREWRNVERDKKTNMKQIMDGIVSIEKNDVNNENANMSANTPAGQMMNFASEVTKDYTSKYLLGKEYNRAHKNGDIHIHDLDYFPTKTTTCIQYDLEDLFNRGFRTKNGTIRTPQSIQSYATLATIVFQTNQNEQHGGQSIPAFDFFMAPGVLKSFRKHVIGHIEFIADLKGTSVDTKVLKTLMNDVVDSISLSVGKTHELAAQLQAIVPLSEEELQTILANAYTKVEKDTHQAMEGFIHNLNTMHSRGGNQVVFSSINYGTDTSPEGRMVIRELLSATVEGLGRGETPVFPIQIFKVKDGISYTEADYEKAVKDFKGAMNGEIAFEAPNFDLLLQACETTATSLFPNFIFLDTPFNVNEAWDANDPRRYYYEVASMGCRTRVFENLHGDKTSFGRGNLSFTTINLPRLAIEAKLEAEETLPTASKKELQEFAVELFYNRLVEMVSFVGEQLKERYDYQRSALAKQFPFLMNNDVWKGGINLGPNDEVGDVINSGTLGIGFIGGHNAMVALFGEGHGSSQVAYDTLYKAVELMNDGVAALKEKYNLNYSVLATPAEGLSGRFTRIDKQKYGEISGVTDRDYYVNSFHIDVQEHISMFDKIKKEAPFHALTGGGHITYVELDGEAKKNFVTILKIVKTMHDEHIGYGSINHPVDTCRECGYKGVIYSKCPVCESEDITRMRRITGYLTGDLETWNSAKRAEEHDRVKHGFGSN